MSGISPILSADIPARSGMPTDPNLHEGYGDALNGIQEVGAKKNRLANMFVSAKESFDAIIKSVNPNEKNFKFITKRALQSNFGNAERYLKALREKQISNITWKTFFDEIGIISEKLQDGSDRGEFEPDSDLDRLKMTINQIVVESKQLPKASLFIN